MNDLVPILIFIVLTLAFFGRLAQLTFGKNGRSPARRMWNRWRLTHPEAVKDWKRYVIYRPCRLLMIASLGLFAFSAVELTVLFFPWSILVLGFIVAWRKKHIGNKLWAYGTAAFATAESLTMGGSKGIILGRLVNYRLSYARVIGTLFDATVSSIDACRESVLTYGERLRRNVVRLPQALHAAIVCPSGGGKGVCFVLNHLFTCAESTICIDLKGENYRLSGAWRKAVFGHRVVVLDPFHLVTDTPDTFNPIDLIDKYSPTAIDDCRDLAQAMVIRTGQERDPHWADSAEAFIATCAAVVVYYGKSEKSVQTVKDLLTDPARLQEAIIVACKSAAWDGMLARMGHELKNFQGDEAASVATTTNRFTGFLSTLAVAASTRSTSFDPTDCRRTGKMTIYLVLPPDRLNAQKGLMRMWISSFLRALMRDGINDGHKTHFLLDEISSLGHMQAIVNALDVSRAYGIRLQFFLQALSQAKAIFPEGQDQTFWSQVTQVFFGTQDLDTAMYISRRLGEQTIIVASGGSSCGTSHQGSASGQQNGSTTRSVSHNDNWSQAARSLGRPEEILQLPSNVAITFTSGVPPIRTRLIPYWELSLSGEKEISIWRVMAFSVSAFVFSLIVFCCLNGMNIREIVRG